MAISTFAKFYFGTEISLTTSKFDFDEGAGELTATVELGVYSLTGLAVALQQELNAAGTDTYLVTFNRDSRVFTVTSDGTFSMLISTGTNASSGCYSVFGFTGAIDLATAGAHVGNAAAGSQYTSQFAPQNYVAAGFRREKGDASVNQSANGEVEVISFGDIQFIEMDLMFITDIPMDGTVIRNNPTGVQDALDFLTFAIKRGPIEFMPDANNSATFNQVLLERTAADSKGTKFKLKEETGKNLPNFYKTDRLEFRII